MAAVCELLSFAVAMALIWSS